MHKKLLATLIGVLTVFILFISCDNSELTYDKAVVNLEKMAKKIKPQDKLVSRGDALVSNQKNELKNSLPLIDKYPITVDPAVTGNETVIELFSSTEKSGTAEPDNWLKIMTEKFNNNNAKTTSGKIIKIRIRNIASGDAYQYIASKKNIPDAFTPSSNLWVRMVEAAGIKTALIEEELLNNVAGVVMKEAVYKKLKDKYNNVDIKTILNSVVQGEISMGYTNPYSSSTGINFLVTILATFANGDESKMLSPEVVSAFEAFQKGVPFVALTTLQMRESVQNDGSLDAFVLEHQTYVNTKVLNTGYMFIPFGVKHSNPLYAIGDIGKDKTDGLKLYSQFLKSGESVAIATQYGFNQIKDYTPAVKAPSGDTLVKAQALWKEKKDAGHPILAVFLSDISGSMGTATVNQSIPIDMLKKALIEGSGFINASNYIGLVTFNERVQRLLEIKQFNALHRAAFITAVNSFSAGGNTGMYDGIMVSLDMLARAKAQIPDGKPMLFVLTDGKTNRGFEYEAVKNLIAAVGIPVYTIGYNADLAELKPLSGLNEAASLNADDQNISFIIGNMLNAQM